MMLRLRTWLGHTHGTGFELLRHFLGGFFDTGMVSSSGEWLKVAIGLGATLFSFTILALNIYWERYQGLQASTQLYRVGIREDLLSFIAPAMALTAVLTVLLWRSMFPTLGDALALAGLPVSARQIFTAKFTALFLLFTGFVFAVALVPSLLFAVVIAVKGQENPSYLVNFSANFATLGGCGVFIFFGLLACQGLLLNMLPARLFARASLFVQALVFILTVGALPLMGRQPATAGWWPPVWFLRLWEAIVTGRGGASPALLAMILPPAVAVALYALSYHRYQRLLFDSDSGRATQHERGTRWRVLERWIRNPRELAAVVFMWKTLARSASHRMILLAYAGLALGWITKGALDTGRPSLRDQGLYGLIAVLAPLALSMLITIGLRYLFSLPVLFAANWIFRTLEKENRAAWLAAVQRVVVSFGIVPVFLVSLPATIGILGWLRGLAVTSLSFLIALMWFEQLFRRWRKLPFTCSYLPGQQSVLFTICRYGCCAGLLATLGQLILFCSADPIPFLALVTFELVVVRKLRAKRRRAWAECELTFDEVPEADVNPLELADDPEPQPFASSSPRPAAALFSKSLVASHGMLPQEWSEEIEDDRKRPFALLQDLREDVRYGLRLIARTPLLSAVVVLTLTVGIGINTSVFTVVNGMALRPHVYKDPDSFLRVIPEASLQSTPRTVSYSEYIAWRDRTRSLRHLAAFARFPAMIGDDDSTGSFGLIVSCNFFAVDGLDRPTLGRLLVADDCHAPGQAPVVVISESLWHGRLASDPRVIGRRLSINNRPVTIVGVVPDRTSGWTFPTTIWMPYTAQPYFDHTRNFFTQDEFLWLSLAGRLAPGISRSQAKAELSVLAHQEDRLHGQRHTSISVTNGSWAAELESTMTGRDLMLFGIFLGAFNLVLFISCANVATLLLSRAATRRREIAVRLSLGAPRVRLVRMLLTESLVLAAIAGLISTYLGWRVPGPLYRLVAEQSPDFPMDPDWLTLAHIAAVVLFTGILAGLAPALESVKVDLTASLKGLGGQVTGIAGGARLRGLLVSAQVALSMVLLVEAGLFAKSENRTLRADPGYSPDKVVVAPLRFPENTTMAAAEVRLQAIARRIRALPGVRAVAFSDEIPLFSHDTVEMRPPTRQDVSQPVDVFTASPEYFETLGIPITRGRGFEDTDLSGVVVSQTLAHAFWPVTNPIGSTLPLPGGAAPVVGIARDIDPLRFGGSDNPVAYRVRHTNTVRNVMSVRFDKNAQSGPAAVRSALREVDPDLVVIARLMQSWIDQVTSVLWNVVSLIVVLGVVATVLATTGIYGAVSFAVSQKTRDLAIRIALGARHRDIIGEVLLSGGKPIAQGLMTGLWLSVATAASLRQSLTGGPLRLDTTDPLLYGGAALLLAAAGLFAMAGPAGRGAHSDPIKALRTE